MNILNKPNQHKVVFNNCNEDCLLQGLLYRYSFTLTTQRCLPLPATTQRCLPLPATTQRCLPLNSLKEISSSVLHEQLSFVGYLT